MLLFCMSLSPKNNIRLVRRSSDSHIYFGNTPYDFLVHLLKQLYLQGHWTVSLLDFDLSTIFTQQELCVWRRRKKTGISELNIYINALSVFTELSRWVYIAILKNWNTMYWYSTLISRRIKIVHFSSASDRSFGNANHG